MCTDTSAANPSSAKLSQIDIAAICGDDAAKQRTCWEKAADDALVDGSEKRPIFSLHDSTFEVQPFFRQSLGVVLVHVLEGPQVVPRETTGGGGGREAQARFSALWPSASPDFQKLYGVGPSITKFDMYKVWGHCTYQAQ